MFDPRDFDRVPDPTPRGRGLKRQRNDFVRRERIKRDYLNRERNRRIQKGLALQRTHYPSMFDKTPTTAGKSGGQVMKALEHQLAAEI